MVSHKFFTRIDVTSAGEKRVGITNHDVNPQRGAARGLPGIGNKLVGSEEEQADVPRPGWGVVWAEHVLEYVRCGWTWPASSVAKPACCTVMGSGNGKENM